MSTIALFEIIFAVVVLLKTRTLGRWWKPWWRDVFIVLDAFGTGYTFYAWLDSMTRIIKMIISAGKTLSRFLDPTLGNEHGKPLPQKVSLISWNLACRYRSMSDARRYAVWPDPRLRSRSRAFEIWKFFYFQKLRHLQWELATNHWFLNYGITSQF